MASHVSPSGPYSVPRHSSHSPLLSSFPGLQRVHDGDVLPSGPAKQLSMTMHSIPATPYEIPGHIEHSPSSFIVWPSSHAVQSALPALFVVAMQLLLVDWHGIVPSLNVFVVHGVHVPSSEVPCPSAQISQNGWAESVSKQLAGPFWHSRVPSLHWLFVPSHSVHVPVSGSKP